MIMRYLIILALALGLVTCDATMLEAESSKAETASRMVQRITGPSQPDIIWLNLDDLGWADFYPNKPGRQNPVRMPAMHSIAECGFRLSRLYATAPVCAPSRWSAIMGKYSQRAGVWSGSDTRRHEMEPTETMGALLQQAGYRTGLYGKWHMFNDPLAFGFDEFWGIRGGHSDYWDGSLIAGPHARYSGSLPTNEPGYITDLIGRHAQDFILSTDPGQPYFLLVAPTAVHLDKYSEYAAPDTTVAHYDTGDPDRDKYLAMIEEVDTKIVKRLLSAIGPQRMSETLIVITSDNGGHYKRAADNGDLRGGKYDMWEGGIRVAGAVCNLPGWSRPGFAAWPKSVSMLDLLPTFLDAAGAPRPPGLDGVSIGDHLEAWANSGPLVFDMGQGTHAVIREWDKMICQPNQDCELYHLLNDPEEALPLADTTSKFSVLGSIYDDWLTEMNQ